MQWRIAAVDGGDNTYVIAAPENEGLPPLGWSIDPVDPVQPGSPVIVTAPPKEFRIQYLEDESRGPEEQAFT